MTGARPPRFARACLTRALPADVRDEVVGDLEERFRRDMAAMGPGAAQWRYRRNVLAFSTRFLVERAAGRLRSLTPLRFSLLDFRIGVRMLVRYPGLTFVGSIALAFAIAIGASVFAFISIMLWPSLPLPEGDRVVAVRLHDDSANQYDDRADADFLRWQRHPPSSLVDLGAGRSLRRNLTTPDGLVEPVMMAEVTASTFDLVRTAPVMGRALTDADAHPAAPPVMVIGQWLWRTRFAADPNVVGRVVTLGATPTTVVGVMPEAMKFPASHEAWVPLRIDEVRVTPRAGASLRVWARLQPGVSMSEASAEMVAIGARASADWPKTHAHLRPVVAPHAQSAASLDPVERVLIGSVNLAVGLLILLISGNVALLMFARAATRESELIIRTALGASRGRIITQFFSEALVLCGVAAVIGLALARAGIRWGIEVFTSAANDGQPLPFWFNQPLPPLSIAYGWGLALFAAVITGVLPALMVTRGLNSRMREATPGGGGARFGGVWTVVIVSQIALTVAFPAVTFFVKRDASQIEKMEIGIPLAEVLSARLSRDRDITTERYSMAVRDLRDGLAALPGVSHVTVADKLPLMWHGHFGVEVDEGGAAPMEQDRDGYRISMAEVDPDYFATFDVAPLAGRLLSLADYTGRPRVVVVNQSFVSRVLGGRNPIGRRVRYKNVENGNTTRPPTEWLEIVGLVRDLGMATEPDPKVAGLYRPLDLKSTSSVFVGVRLSGDVAAVAAEVRRLAANADVTLRVSDVQTLDQVPARALGEIDFWTRLLAAVSLSALMLSLTGIYAVMSFVVSKRTREIGIRIALGSDRKRVVLAVLRRPLLQVTGGIVVGALLTMFLSGQILPELGPMFVIIGYSVVMLCVCLLASLVPVRRALRVNPIDALRAE